MEMLSPSSKIKNKDIYEGIHFNNEPYHSTNKFHVYLPKLNDAPLPQPNNPSNKIKKEHNVANFALDKLSSDQLNYENMINVIPSKTEKNHNAHETIKTAPDHPNSPPSNQLQSKTFRIKNGSPSLKSLISDQIFKNLEEKSKFYTPKHYKISCNPYITNKPIHLKLYEKSTISFKTKFSPLNSFTTSNSSFSPYSYKNLDNSAYQRVILDNRDIFVNKEKLLKGIESLDELKLLEKKRMNIKIVTKRGKVDYIMNDFHARATNPGFARNGLGNFYTR